MARQQAVAAKAERLLGTAVVATSPVAGGDVAVATRLRLSSGRSALLKSLTPAPPHFFQREAEGLALLRSTTAAGGVATPDVLAVDDECLVLDWVETGRPTADAAARFGRALASTHAAGATQLGGSFGAEHDGYIARLPLPNRPLPSWAEFHAERRIAPYLKVLRDKRLIAPADADAVERAAARTGEIVPAEPPALLHGDLWNGNVLWTTDERAVVIDPAVHLGHREVDLAMLGLFGLPQLAQVLEAYEEVSPLADGWEDRLAFHQLFPLLVHACLFGGRYAARAGDLARRYL